MNVAKTKNIKSKDECVVTVKFTRSMDKDEVDMMKMNWHAHKIHANPQNHLSRALVAQLSYELQTCYDNGVLNGDFQCTDITLHKAAQKV